jgi:hypothetical protein
VNNIPAFFFLKHVQVYFSLIQKLQHILLNGVRASQLGQGDGEERERTEKESAKEGDL